VVVDEVERLDGRTPAGRRFVVEEILLVDDNGPDDSARIIGELARLRPDLVKPIWLSRNFGQHAATLAGMEAARGEWVVTMDEDGQHDPVSIGVFLDAALDADAQIVYSDQDGATSRGRLRDMTSAGAKWLFRVWLAPGVVPTFGSFRLIDGDIARQAAKVAAHGMYLDVALAWISRPAVYAKSPVRGELRSSGYSTRKLIAHFWRLVLSSGTRALRVVGALGIGFALIAAILAIVIIIGRLTGAVSAPGWASLIVVVLFCTGLLMLALTVIAEYLGMVLNATIGRPLFVRLDRPARATARVPRTDAPRTTDDPERG
jgi:undecaprenyl-phosphate 4-deoxy-4-formamido-L-arabinose transferase